MELYERAQQMTMVEFIEKFYPIADRIKKSKESIRQQINADSAFPFDYIGYDEYGERAKFIKLNDYGRAITVTDLLSLEPDEVEQSGDEELSVVYFNYIRDLKQVEVNILDIQKSLQEYSKYLESKKADANVLSV